jgi:hypothetical protein
MRTAVLRSAGFDVILCDAVDSLLAALRGETRVDAVILGDADPAAAELALDAIRSYAGLPLIQFQSKLSAEPLSDLLIAPQTPPQTWLCAITELIGCLRDAATDPSWQPETGDAAPSPAGALALGGPPRDVQGNVPDWHAVALAIWRRAAAQPPNAKERTIAPVKSAPQL